MDNSKNTDKNLKVSEEAHRDLKILVAELGKTFDETIKILIKQYCDLESIKINHESTRK